MKRLFVIAFVAAYGGLWAQNPQMIDTIWNREPTYFYQYWFDSADFRNTSKPECNKDISYHPITYLSYISDLQFPTQTLLHHQSFQ